MFFVQEDGVGSSNPPRVTRALVAVAVAAALAALAAVPAGAAETGVGRAFFLRGDLPVPVPRSAPTVPALLESLLAGPRPVERARGLRSSIPGRATL
ncbi:MAG: hypothetical protein ACRC50_05600, partial [Gaiella sp.]